jgi:hypothetical protein
VRETIFFAFGAALAVGASVIPSSAEPLLPGTYRGLSCVQIVQEGRSISRKGFSLVGLPVGTGGTDGSPSASANVFVWPAPSVHLGDDKQLQLSLAERQMDALEQESIGSQCSIQFLREVKAPAK